MNCNFTLRAVFLRAVILGLLPKTLGVINLMGKQTQSNESLPVDRAFVVQFRPAHAEGVTRFEGRIEHLASGRVEYFSSHDELRTLLDQLLPGQ